MQLRPIMQSGLSRPRVVVAEPFAEQGLAVLRDAGIEVDSQVGRPRAELVAALAGADGLIVRSETRVDRELLAAGPRLTVVARAGVGVDAIDVDAATDAGILVLNTPGANTHRRDRADLRADALAGAPHARGGADAARGHLGPQTR